MTSEKRITEWGAAGLGDRTGEGVRPIPTVRGVRARSAQGDAGRAVSRPRPGGSESCTVTCPVGPGRSRDRGRFRRSRTVRDGLHPRYGILGMHRSEGTPMSIRQSLLALLEAEPRYGYQLRQEFEHRTGGTWPLNVGQVYSTLARLERDGLVEPVGQRPTRATTQQVFYAITDAGRDEVRAWFASPVERDGAGARRAGHQAGPRGDRARRRRPGRAAAPAHRDDARPADYTRLKATPSTSDGQPADLAWSLVLESLDLRGRGRGPLARPLRGPAGPHAPGRGATISA